MNKSGFNKRELELIENIQAAESYVSGDNDLELILIMMDGMHVNIMGMNQE